MLWWKCGHTKQTNNNNNNKTKKDVLLKGYSTTDRWMAVWRESWPHQSRRRQRVSAIVSSAVGAWSWTTDRKHEKPVTSSTCRRWWPCPIVCARAHAPGPFDHSLTSCAFLKPVPRHRGEGSVGFFCLFWKWTKSILGQGIGGILEFWKWTKSIVGQGIFGIWGFWKWAKSIVGRGIWGIWGFWKWANSSFRTRDWWDFLFVLKVDKEHLRARALWDFGFESGRRAS